MVTASPVKQNRQNANHAPPSRPVIWRTVKLHNEDARRVANDTVRQTLRALSRIDNVIPKLTKLEHAVKIKEWATKYISDCHAVLTEEKARMHKVLEDNGLDSSSVEYTGVHPYSIQISSPTSAQYVIILTLLDEVLADIECLWITGIIDIKQHVDAPHQLCRRVRTLCNEIVLLQTRYEDAFRSLKENEHAKAIADKAEHLAVKATAFKREVENGKVAPEVLDAIKKKEEARKAAKGRHAKPVPNAEGIVEIGVEDGEEVEEQPTPKKTASKKAH